MSAIPLRRQPLPLDAALLLGNLPAAIVVVDGDGLTAAANPAAEQMFSVSEAVLIGRPFADLLLPHGTLLDLLRQVQATGISLSKYGLDVGLARKGLVTVDAHLTPPAERPECVLLMLHPCSRAQRLDLRTGGVGRSVAALARTLAHEVKNPLSGIRGAAQLLEPYVTDAEDKGLVGLICDEVDRICALVDRMDVFSDSIRLERASFNVHAALEHVRRIAENGFARHLTIHEAYDPSLPEVDGDRDRLIQVFLNLVKNAGEAAPREGGTITIRTHYQHGLRMALSHGRASRDLPITVEVRDNGPGVPDDIRPHLFEPFVTSKHGGGGLGLALVAKIVDDHGGIVSHDRDEGGTVFRVRLPATTEGGGR